MQRATFPLKLVAAFLMSTGTPALAQSDADFLKGRQMTIAVGGAAGTIYDNYARLLARHLPKHLPDSPRIIIQNMPGASGIKVVNYIANVAPRDGSTLATTLSSIATAPLTNPEQAQFNASKLSWIGSVTNEPFVAYVWTTAPIATLEEAKKTEVIIGTTGPGASGTQLSLLARDMLGFKFKVVTGYSDSNTLKLALERGEVQGVFGTSWRETKASNPGWITGKQIRIIAQIGLRRIPDLPDVPMFLDEAKSEADRQAMVFVMSRQEYGKPFFAPPGIPLGRLAILRTAFEATYKDPAFLKEAEDRLMAVDGAMNGEELAAMVTKVTATSKEVVDRVQRIVAKPFERPTP